MLDSLTKELISRGKDFVSVDDKELLCLLDEKISEQIQADSFISNFIQRNFHNAFVVESARDVLRDCVLAICQMSRAGSFRAVSSEVGFGRIRDGGDSIGEYKICLSGKRVLFLDGKIDRFDVAKTEVGETGLVFDYKRKKTAFSWPDFYYGLDMQLAIYMLATNNCDKLPNGFDKAIGAFYVPIEGEVTKVTPGSFFKTSGKFSHKAQGIFNGEYFHQLDKTDSNRFYNFMVKTNGDQYGRYNDSGALKPEDFEKVLKFGEKRMVELAEWILSGRIDISPYRKGGKSPCSYCKYRAVCHFDWQINEYRFLEDMNKEKCLAKISDILRK